MADIAALLDALNVFSSAPDKDSLAKANAWLQDFQHSVNPFRMAAPDLSDNTSGLPLAMFHSPMPGQHATLSLFPQMRPWQLRYSLRRPSGLR
jgi:hypothetical protein